MTSLRENIKAMKAQLDPRSDWVKTQSAVDNPMVLLTLKPEVIDAKKLTIEDQNQILRDVVDEVCSPLFYRLLDPSLSLPLTKTMLTTIPTVPSPRRPNNPPQSLSPWSRRQPS
jgi:hypothetical protein